ncbi:MAG: hypothetical protein WCE79_25565 [Xanthobacteraceae bacterium]
MPTPMDAYSAVAHVIGGIPPDNSSAVEEFYEHKFPTLPEHIRTAVADWLVAHDSSPDDDALEELRRVWRGNAGEFSTPKQLKPKIITEVPSARKYSSYKQNRGVKGRAFRAFALNVGEHVAGHLVAASALALLAFLVGYAVADGALAVAFLHLIRSH